MAEARQDKVREAVGVFHDRESFVNAVDDLMSAGFDRADLSLLAGEQAVEEKLGRDYRRIEELADDPKVPRAAYVSHHTLAEGKTAVIGGLAYIGAVVGAGAAVASGGTLAAAIAAAALAGGGSGLVARAVPRSGPRRLAAGTARARRPAALGARARPGARGADARDPEAGRRHACARARTAGLARSGRQPLERGRVRPVLARRADLIGRTDTPADAAGCRRAPRPRRPERRT